MHSGLIILWGKTSEETPGVFHLYQKTPGWKKVGELKGLCEHGQFVCVTPCTVKNREFLGVSCPWCHTIHLLDTDSQEIITAFQNPEYYPSLLCKGDGDVMYVVNYVMNNPVFELKIGQIRFTGPQKTIESGMQWIYSMQYIPSNRLLVFSSWEDKLVRAVSVETGEKVWEVKGEVDSKICCPHGMLFSQQYQVLLVADGWNCRVLVLDPRNGSHQRTLYLHREQEMMKIRHLYLHENELFAHHHVGFQHFVMHFTFSVARGQEKLSSVTVRHSVDQSEGMPDSLKYFAEKYAEISIEQIVSYEFSHHRNNISKDDAVIKPT